MKIPLKMFACFWMMFMSLACATDPYELDSGCSSDTYSPFPSEENLDNNFVLSQEPNGEASLGNPLPPETYRSRAARQLERLQNYLKKPAHSTDHLTINQGNVVSLTLLVFGAACKALLERYAPVPPLDTTIVATTTIIGAGIFVITPGHKTLKTAGLVACGALTAGVFFLRSFIPQIGYLNNRLIA